MYFTVHSVSGRPAGPLARGSEPWQVLDMHPDRSAWRGARPWRTMTRTTGDARDAQDGGGGRGAAHPRRGLRRRAGPGSAAPRGRRGAGGRREGRRTRAAVPPPADLAALPVTDPLHVVPGLPGTDGLSQRANDDPALGRWQTAVVVRDTAARAAPAGVAVGVVPAMTFEVRTDPAGGRAARPLAAGHGRHPRALPSQDVTQVNDRTAWIDSADTEAAGTDWTVQVDTTAQTITVDDGTGVRVLPVKATGSAGTPTPHVPAFLVGTRWLEPGTTTPRVLLLSSQSESMDDYDKRTHTSATAIHTTTLPGTGEVSNGCIRVTDDVLDLLWRAPPAPSSPPSADRSTSGTGRPDLASGDAHDPDPPPRTGARRRLRARVHGAGRRPRVPGPRTGAGRAPPGPAGHHGRDRLHARAPRPPARAVVWQQAFQAKWVNLAATLVCVWVWRRHGMTTRALWAFLTVMAAWAVQLGAKGPGAAARPVVEDALENAPGPASRPGTRRTPPRSP